MPIDQSLFDPINGAAGGFAPPKLDAAWSPLSALAPEQGAQADDLVRQARAAADEAAALAGGFFGNGWRSLIGAESTSEALRANADAARKLADTLAAKRPGLTREGFATFQGAAPALGNEAARSAAAQASPVGALKDVGGATAKDLGKVAQGVGKGVLWGLGMLPVVLLGVLVVWLWSMMPRKRA